jgi:hypothetical protein
MLSLKIIDGKHYIVNTDQNPAKMFQKIVVKTNIEGIDQSFELKLNDQINPIATPIIVLYSNNVAKKRFLPFSEDDIARYQIIKILIEQFGIQKYFPKIEIGYVYLQQGIVNGIFEDLVYFRTPGGRICSSTTSCGTYLSGLSEQYSNCLPLNVVHNVRLESDVFDCIDIYEWQMFLIMIPLMSLWDIALHNILLRLEGNLYFVHIDFGDIPIAWDGKKRTLIVNPKLLEYFNKKKSKIHTDVIKFINGLDSAVVVQKINEMLAVKLEKMKTLAVSKPKPSQLTSVYRRGTRQIVQPNVKRIVPSVPKTIPDQKVWKKLWDDGKNIEVTISKMKELAVNGTMFQDFFEKLCKVISN